MHNDDDDDEHDITEIDLTERFEVPLLIIRNELDEDEVIGILDDELDDELDVILLQIERQLIELEFDEQLDVILMLMLNLDEMPHEYSHLPYQPI